MDLEDKIIKEETKEKFHKLCDRYDQIISKGTLLVEMDIDTGDSPPIACRPYTLPLKHHDWVKKEIEILDWAGIINKSISAWASPVVIVPKKSKPGEPPKRRMCVDFRQLNGKLPEVEKIALCRLRWFKLNVSKYQKDVKLSKRCQVFKKMSNVKK